MPDVVLLRAVLAEIEADPGSWDQAQWARRTPCGTTYCFAGHTVRVGLPGAVVDWGTDWDAPDGWEVGALVRLANGDMRAIGDVARELIGLDRVQSERLFYSLECDTLEGLRRVVDELCAPAPVAPGAVP